MMIKLFEKTYPILRNGRASSIPQNAGGSFHFGSELDRHSEIKLDKLYKARDLLNIIRARTTSSEAFKSSFFRDDGNLYRVEILIEKED